MNKQEFIEGLGVHFKLVNQVYFDDSIPALYMVPIDLWDAVISKYGSFTEMYEQNNGSQPFDKEASEYLKRYISQRETLPPDIQTSISFLISY